MIVNKSTSDALLVSTLVVLDTNGKSIGKVTEFDTETKETTLEVGGPVTALSYLFCADTEEDQDTLIGMLDDITALSVTVSGGKKYKAKKSMDDSVHPDDYLVFNTHATTLQMYIATCTNCSTNFLIFMADEGNIWNGEKVGGGDTFQTMTQLDETGLTCDNCTNAVAMLDENPW